MTLDGKSKREYQRLWFAQRREDWIVENGPCALCGSWNRLQVDHKDAKTKTIPAARLWSLSLDNPKRIAELLKCWVLCKSCHDEKTKRHRDRPHGSKQAMSKLNEDQVLKIRSLFATGIYTKMDLARQFGVSDRCIRFIISRQTWTHI